MKMVLALSAVAAMLVPASAVGAGAGTEQPSVSGTILVPTGAARAQRCASEHSIANGTFGWILPVTGGASFSLTTPNPTLDDVNIGFYTALGTCAAPAALAGSYLNGPGNESGTVPSTATVAIIFVGSLPVPPEHAGAGRPSTPFTYL